MKKIKTEDKIKRKELEKDNIIKDVKKLFRLKKEIDDNTIKSIRNLSRLKKQNEAIKDRIIGTLEIFLSRKMKIIINQ